MTDEVVEIYSDGACRGNPGPGGWGALLRAKGAEKELWGGEAQTTNNRMELTAVIRALDALKRPSKVRLYTDSLYVMKGISEWITSWKRRGWRTADKKPVKNEDLWRELDRAAARQRDRMALVKGHAGHPENERADRLAIKEFPLAGIDKESLCGRSSGYRDDRARRQKRRPHHRDRLCRDPEPQHQRRALPPLPEPGARGGGGGDPHPRQDARGPRLEAEIRGGCARAPRLRARGGAHHP